MPELPEVETTLRGIRPHLQGRRIARLLVREPRLRRPIPAETPNLLAGQTIGTLSRRGKYILIGLDRGTLLVHLGMSGSLRVVPAASRLRRHDHLDLVLGGGAIRDEDSDERCLRFHDPRRFGIFLWTPEPPAIVEREHSLLRNLGPEPLGPDFDGETLYRLSRSRRLAVKAFVMDASVVVGVGNIYANEALFLAGIHPARACGRVGPERYRRLAEVIRAVLLESIAQGGTTLRDFVQEDGQPGYFAQSLRVYGREGEPCKVCGGGIRQRRIGQRSSFFCPRCQH